MLVEIQFESGFRTSLYRHFLISPYHLVPLDDHRE